MNVHIQLPNTIAFERLPRGGERRKTKVYQINPPFFNLINQIYNSICILNYFKDILSLQSGRLGYRTTQATKWPLLRKEYK
jgi:hypothetical protein